MIVLKKYLKNYMSECFIAPLFKFLEAAFELIVPILMAEIIDVGIKNNNIDYIYLIALILCGFALLGLGCSITAQYYAAKAAHGFGTELRQDMYKKINSFSHAELDKIGLPTLITRITTDITQAEKGVNRFLRLFLRSPFIVIGALVASFIIDAKMGLIFLGLTIIMSIVIFVIMAITIPKNKKIQAALDNVNSITRENLSGTRVVRAFSMQEEEIKRFSSYNNRLTHLQMIVGKISSLLNPITYVMVNLGIVAILWFGGGYVNTGSLTQGDIAALINYMTQTLLALIAFANLIVVMASGSASSIRIKEILNMKSSLVDGDKINSSYPEDIIDFFNVSFKYNKGSQNTLSNIAFEIKRGETVGIIGGTGSGKSTLINLMARFYDINEGEILVDGMSVRNYKLKALRDKFGIVLQKAALFKGTIRENLLWGNENATDEQMMKALEIAQAKDIIVNFSLGLDKMIEQGGKNLSGGQKQRLTIARALVRKPEILVLDDSASALDYATDFKLRKAIKELNTTVIIISQRISAIKNVDKILVMDDGKLVAIGTNDELMQNSEIYKEICATQLSL